MCFNEIAYSNIMRQRIDALFIHDANGFLLSVNDNKPLSAPRLYIARTHHHVFFRFRHDLPEHLRRALSRYCHREPLVKNQQQALQHLAVYRKLLKEHSPLQSEWFGPAYYIALEKPERPIIGHFKTVMITEENASLLNTYFKAWLPKINHASPFIAVIHNNQAIAVCASVRISQFIHEAGVETATPFRRKGLANYATYHWAEQVKALGAQAVYSTSWKNTASLHTAESLNLNLIGIDFHIS